MPFAPATVDALRFTVSGAGELLMVHPDESRVLQDYANVRDSGRGTLFIEFADAKVIKYEVKHGAGAQLLNSLLPGSKKLRD